VAIEKNRWVVFDFDGTISETSTALIKFYNEKLVPKYKCRPLEDSDLELLKDMSVGEKLSFLELSFFKLPFAIGRARKEFPPYLKDIPVIDGFIKAGEELIKKGYKLAILSSNKQENIEEYLEKNSLSHLFDVVSCDKGRSLFVKHKTIKRFIKNMNIAPTDMVYVGDEGRDVLACEKCDVPVISVTWGWDSREVLKRVNENYFADEPRELVGLVEQILG
jgi:phosphoglycolate phosphatase